jgi:ABC-type branched-subunit amino acid transport system substrate-binding protein
MLSKKEERLIELLELDENSISARAENIVNNKRVVAVLGYFNEKLLLSSAPMLAASHIPIVTPLFISKPLEGVISLGFNPKEEARFIANYARNIKQQRVMYIIRESGINFDVLTDSFSDVYNYFETPIKKILTISNSKSEKNIVEQIEKICDTFKNVYIGGIFIATSPELSAKIIKKIRSIDNLALDIYGPSELSTYVFSNSALNETPNDSLALTHGIITTSPILFDTSNEQAQHFYTQYQNLFNHAPDWIAAFGYEASNIAITKIFGENSFKNILHIENAQIPIHVGSYIGSKLISAPIQLLPIAEGANFNYIEALRQGEFCMSMITLCSKLMLSMLGLI